MKSIQNRTRLFFVSLAIGGALALVLSLSGCNTVSGIARDMQTMSEATRDAMSKN